MATGSTKQPSKCKAAAAGTKSKQAKKDSDQGSDDVDDEVNEVDMKPAAVDAQAAAAGTKSKQAVDDEVNEADMEPAAVDAPGSEGDDGGLWDGGPSLNGGNSGIVYTPVTVGHRMPHDGSFAAGSSTDTAPGSAANPLATTGGGFYASPKPFVAPALAADELESQDPENAMAEDQGPAVVTAVALCHNDSQRTPVQSAPGTPMRTPGKQRRRQNENSAQYWEDHFANFGKFVEQFGNAHVPQRLNSPECVVACSVSWWMTCCVLLAVTMVGVAPAQPWRWMWC
jgi:hypothetical protein